MELREQFEASGDWLFRWRSYLPIVLFGPLIAVLVGRTWPNAHDAPVVPWDFVCFLVAAVGLMVRALVAGYAPAGTSGRNTQRQVAKALNTTGAYSIVRHPLYVGNFLIGLGWIAFPGNGWLVFVYILSFWLYYERIMLREESFLRQEFGSAFHEWANRTPAFIPSSLRWSAPPMRLSLRTVIRREYHSFCLTVAVFVALRAIYIVEFGRTWTIEPFWVGVILFDLFVFLSVRLLRKRTTLLKVAGR